MEPRRAFLLNGLRLAALAALAGVCALLGSRKPVFECTQQCGQCRQFKGGQCRRGLL